MASSNSSGLEQEVTAPTNVSTSGDSCTWYAGESCEKSRTCYDCLNVGVVGDSCAVGVFGQCLSISEQIAGGICCKRRRQVFDSLYRTEWVHLLGSLRARDEKFAGGSQQMSVVREGQSGQHYAGDRYGGGVVHHLLDVHILHQKAAQTSITLARATSTGPIGVVAGPSAKTTAWSAVEFVWMEINA
ncbi:hypothetical protein GN958_ATG02180 [Phytophthora infestans]|uniref:Uncharacterized protein n=1 Tax=Phytophthora infestans TaxID=4787 RepID=A0A8S9V692_PHYIN|nr:hypothetical protein GN958_ATG02180 [Phytophthora infestans]